MTPPRRRPAYSSGPSGKHTSPRVQVSVEEGELARWRHAAASRGVTLADFIREAVESSLGYPSVTLHAAPSAGGNAGGNDSRRVFVAPMNRAPCAGDDRPMWPLAGGKEGANNPTAPNAFPRNPTLSDSPQALRRRGK